MCNPQALMTTGELEISITAPVRNSQISTSLFRDYIPPTAPGKGTSILTGSGPLPQLRSDVRTNAGPENVSPVRI